MIASVFSVNIRGLELSKHQERVIKRELKEHLIEALNTLVEEFEIPRERIYCKILKANKHGEIREA